MFLQTFVAGDNCCSCLSIFVPLVRSLLACSKPALQSGHERDMHKPGFLRCISHVKVLISHIRSIASVEELAIDSLNPLWPQSS